MKQLILATLMSLLFIGCQSELPRVSETGALQFESVDVAGTQTETLSRAIDADLIVEICQNGQVVEYKGQTFRFTNGEFPNIVYLPVGTYQVKAFNAAYEQAAGWTNADLGSQVYYKEENVEISEDKVANIAMQVPMVNIGVTFTLPEGFEQSFSEYHFSVTDGSRTVSVTTPETIYIDATSSFTVTLQAKNVDNESVETSLTHETVTAGTLYTIAYQVAQSYRAAFSTAISASPFS